MARSAGESRPHGSGSPPTAASAGLAYAQRMPLAHIDWARTRAFSLPSDMTAYVRVNLKGREPEGVVAAGHEYEALCDELDRRIPLADAWPNLTRQRSSGSFGSTGSSAVRRRARCPTSVSSGRTPSGSVAFA